MQRLVGFANSDSQDANHALGMGESDEYEILTLKNIEVYHSGQPSLAAAPQDKEEEEAIRKKNGIFASSIVSKMNSLKSSLHQDHTQQTKLDDAFPPAQLGKELLGALTKKMAEDSKTDADTLEVVNALPEDFKKRLHSYFRRSSELLRHFFGLRRLTDGSPGSTAYNQKLQKIVKGMETVYREMDEMRKEQEATGRTGETMRKMCLQIMDQLDWAFKLHREGTGSGGGGGFVTIEEF
jgi:transcription initiation factor TFIIH subunit 1